MVTALLTVERSDHFRYDLFKKNKSSLQKITTCDVAPFNLLSFKAIGAEHRYQNLPIIKLKCLSFEQWNSRLRIRLSSAEGFTWLALVGLFFLPRNIHPHQTGAAHLFLLICPTSFERCGDRLSAQSRQGEKIVKKKKVSPRSPGGGSRAGQRSKQPAERRRLAGMDMLSNRRAYNYTAEESINVRHM